MAATNTKTERSHRYDREHRTAGGYGVHAAKQDAEAKLRRVVMTCLLWEDLAYESGEQTASEIARLVPLVPPVVVASIALEARGKQKLRHVPLFIAREMARHDSHKGLVGDVLAGVIQRPDELSEFLALYWSEGRQTLSGQVKKGLARAFKMFDQYQLAKWNRTNKAITLRDVMFMVHPKPRDQEQAELWRRLVNGQLTPPDTWEVAISDKASDKKEQWTRLIRDGRLGALALLKNLRNMQQADVPSDVISKGILAANPKMLLPIDFIRARDHATAFQRELEDLMYRCCARAPKLPGWSLFIVDVSGSMASSLSNKSQYDRMEAASAMTILAAEMCERITIAATAGNDTRRIHATKVVPPHRGFALSETILQSRNGLGRGGIFTRQCLAFLRHELKGERPDRIIVFSDSQDCDYPDSGVAEPFGTRNYIVDVSAHRHGVAYEGIWDAEVSGWSEHFLSYIANLESACLN